jgi:hypothetical protein
MEYSTSGAAYTPLLAETPATKYLLRSAVTNEYDEVVAPEITEHVLASVVAAARTLAVQRYHE